MLRQDFYATIELGVKNKRGTSSKMNKKEAEQRIVVDPDIMTGKPIIKGTRVPVDAILQRMADGMTIDKILEEFPTINRKDVKAALEFATAVLRGEESLPETQEREKKQKRLRLAEIQELIDFLKEHAPQPFVSGKEGGKKWMSKEYAFKKLGLTE